MLQLPTYIWKYQDCLNSSSYIVVSKAPSTTHTKHSKVRESYRVTLLNGTLIIEWYMARLIVKNGHQKNTCHDETRLCSQNIYIISTSLVTTIIGRACVIALKNKRTLTFEFL